jgi:hypothetical protein
MGKRFKLRTYHSGLKYLFGHGTLNARKNMWLEFLNEYDFDIKHIKGKENKVVDALSRRVHEMYATTISMYTSYLKDRILEIAKSYLQYMEINTKLQQYILQQKIDNFELKEDEIILYIGKIYVPNSQELKSLILKYMNNVPYARHPSYHNTIKFVKSQHYWPGMKIEVVDFIAKCLEFQKVKAKQRHPVGLRQPLPIPMWKWEVVTMDFITKLPKTTKQHDSIMVVVDKLTKGAHFIPVKLTHKETNIVDIYMREIARLHGIPKKIVSNKDSKFTSKFWKGLFNGFATNLKFSTTYHLESDGKTKRVNQVIEDMLRMYVMDKPSKWEDYFHLAEFAYNNGYQASLKMIPFEALYGRKCNTPVSWHNPTDRAVVGPELLRQMEEQMVRIKLNLKATQYRKFFYAD